MSDLSRRSFQKAAAVTALSYSRVLGANDRVQMGYIGVGNRGDQVHEAFLEWGDQTTVALCDLREDYMDFAAKKSRANPKKYNDYKKLLDDKDVEAVVIATPDHWHALMCVDACRAGKDVYVEKPLSLTVSEGRRMVQVAQETKRVTQVGIHRRSVPVLQEAAEFVRSGGIGHVTVAKGYHVQNEWPNGIGKGDDAPPPDFDWDKWLGPAPKVPYNRNRAFYNFRWFYDYSGGQITNFGVHYMDMIRWCLGKDAPRSVVAMGGRYAVNDNREIPDTCEVLWDFGETLVIFCQYNANGAPTNASGTRVGTARHQRDDVFAERQVGGCSGEDHGRAVWEADAAGSTDGAQLRTQQKASHGAEDGGQRKRRDQLAREELSGVREVAEEVQLRHSGRTFIFVRDDSRASFAADA